MCDFKPGDEVVCVDASPSHRGRTAVRQGEIYTVHHVDDWPSVDGTASVYLVGVAGNTGRGGFRASRFRRVQRRKAHLSIESFLTIKPGFEEPRRPKAPAKKRERAQ